MAVRVYHNRRPLLCLGYCHYGLHARLARYSQVPYRSRETRHSPQTEGQSDRSRKQTAQTLPNFGGLQRSEALPLLRPRDSL